MGARRYVHMKMSRHLILQRCPYRYTVFSLGNSTYEHYQAMGRLADKMLKKLGATCVFPRGEGDDDKRCVPAPVVMQRLCRAAKVLAMICDGEATVHCLLSFPCLSVCLKADVIPSDALCLLQH